MLLRCIRAENRKLRRSPIGALFLTVPAISAVYGTFNFNMNLGILTHGWYDLWTQYTLFYAIFFFAPLIGVYAAYLWRLEHRGHNWNLIMTAPVRPFCLYFAKFCVVTKMAVLTQAWLLVLFPHSASVMSSTRRTDTPARYISIRASSTLLSRRR